MREVAAFDKLCRISRTRVDRQPGRGKKDSPDPWCRTLVWGPSPCSAVAARRSGWHSMMSP